MSGENDRNIIVNVRFTRAQMDLIDAHSEATNQSVSSLIRAALGHYLFNGPMPHEGRQAYSRRATPTRGKR